MIAVGPNPRFKIKFMPVVKKISIAVFTLSGVTDVTPLVENLVLDENPQFVTEFKKPFVGRIVRRAYRVDSRLLKEKKPALLRLAVPRRTQNAELMMHRNAVQRNASSVEHKAAPVRVVRNRTDAVAVIVPLDIHGVKVRIVDIPETGILYGKRFLLKSGH